MSFGKSVKWRRVCAFSICIGTALASACSDRSIEAKTLDIATITSVVNSGLLSALLPVFEKNAGITIRVHAAGSGRALEMLNDQIVDLVISHAPRAEERMLATHTEWRYRKIASNQFSLVGPGSDSRGGVCHFGQRLGGNRTLEHAVQLAGIERFSAGRRCCPSPESNGGNDNGKRLVHRSIDGTGQPLLWLVVYPTAALLQAMWQIDPRWANWPMVKDGGGIGLAFCEKTT